MHQTTCTEPGCPYVTARGDQCNFHRAGYTERLVVPELGPCHEWAGKIDPRGYGWVTMTGRRNPDGAHRIAYRISHGPLTPGAVVRHRCDNPPCIRREHLLSGSRLDNIQDAVDRDRVAHGESVHFAVLTEAQVVEARERYATGTVTCPELAAQYGVHRRNMLKALTGQTWKRAGGPIADGGIHFRGAKHTKALLTEDSVREIRTRYAAGGVIMRELAAEYGVSTPTIGSLLARRSWKQVD